MRNKNFQFGKELFKANKGKVGVASYMRFLQTLREDEAAASRTATGAGDRHSSSSDGGGSTTTDDMAATAAAAAVEAEAAVAARWDRFVASVEEQVAEGWLFDEEAMVLTIDGGKGK